MSFLVMSGEKYSPDKNRFFFKAKEAYKGKRKNSVKEKYLK